MRIAVAVRIFFLYLCTSIGSQGLANPTEIKRESGVNPEQFPLL